MPRAALQLVHVHMKPFATLFTYADECLVFRCWQVFGTPPLPYRRLGRRWREVAGYASLGLRWPTSAALTRYPLLGRALRRFDASQSVVAWPVLRHKNAPHGLSWRSLLSEERAEVVRSHAGCPENACSDCPVERLKECRQAVCTSEHRLEPAASTTVHTNKTKSAIGRRIQLAFSHWFSFSSYCPKPVNCSCKANFANEKHVKRKQEDFVPVGLISRRPDEGTKTFLHSACLLALFSPFLPLAFYTDEAHGRNVFSSCFFFVCLSVFSC